MECSPILLASFDSVVDASFSTLSWLQSICRDDSMSISVPSVLECWIHVNDETTFERDEVEA